MEGKYIMGCQDCETQELLMFWAKLSPRQKLAILQIMRVFLQ